MHWMESEISVLIILVFIFFPPGASSGIGMTCALEFAKWGAKLALTGRNAERLDEAAKRCQELGLSSKNVSDNITMTS